MAEYKKGFILYADLLTVVKKLVLEDRKNKTNYSGELFYHILQYVNDDDPIPINFIVDMAFEPIKLQLKRDLDKWEETRGKRSDSGNKSAGKKAFNKWLKELKYVLTKEQHEAEKGYCLRKKDEHYGTYMFYYYEHAIEWHNIMLTKSTSVKSVEENSTKPTVSVNDNVSVTVNVNDNVIVIKKTILDRESDFKKSLHPFLGQYGKDLLNDFYLYWTEKKPKGRKMLFEMKKTFDIERRLITWNKNNFNKNNNGNSKISRQESFDKSNAELIRAITGKGN